MTDRETLASNRPAVGRLGPHEFDPSIFEKVARQDDDDPSERDDDQDDDLEADEPPPQREGLPDGFRMRHDSHYVEELTSRDPRRGHRCREHEAMHAVQAAPRAYTEIGESLDAIGACLHLFGRANRPASERAALDLIDAEVCRAAWLVQALSVLDDELPVANAPVDPGPIVRRIAGVLAPGRNRCGAAIAVDAGAPGLRVRGDEPLLTVAVAGIVMALQSLVERVDGAVVRVRVREDEGGGVAIEAVQDALRLPASWRARFLDPRWIDRPGGRRVAVSLAASRRIADVHEGTMAVGDAPHGGCRVTLTLPRATA